MNIEKLKVNTDAVIPLMATFPYGITVDPPQKASLTYDPESQLTHFAGRDFSTSREDESAGGIFASKIDTKKDD